MSERDSNENECSVCGTDTRATAICSEECETFLVEQRAAMEQTECQDCCKRFTRSDMAETVDGPVCDGCVDRRAESADPSECDLAYESAWEGGMFI